MSPATESLLGLMRRHLKVAAELEAFSRKVRPHAAEKYREAAAGHAAIAANKLAIAVAYDYRILPLEQPWTT